MSKLVRVQVRELAWTDGSAGLTVRWEATGPGGGLLPVLDADIRLAPAGEDVTLLTMADAYRPPLGPLGDVLDRAILHLRLHRRSGMGWRMSDRAPGSRYRWTNPGQQNARLSPAPRMT
jgi:hypothetical protein